MGYKLIIGMLFLFTPCYFLRTVTGCKNYLYQGCFSWRHDSIHCSVLQNCARHTSLSDLPGFFCPSIIPGNDFRPDILLILPSYCLYVLELTIGYESDLSSNSIRKEEEYRQLIVELRSRYKEIHLVNLPMGAFSVMSRSSTSFLDIMKDLYLGENTRSFVIRRLVTITIRSTNYVFY